MDFDAIVNEIEEPFGVSANDLALNTMSEMIEATLREMAGEKIDLTNLEQGYTVD